MNDYSSSLPPEPRSSEPTQAAVPSAYPSAPLYPYMQPASAPPPFSPYGPAGDDPPRRALPSRWLMLGSSIALVVLVVGALIVVVISKNSSQTNASMPSGQATPLSSQASPLPGNPTQGSQPTPQASPADGPHHPGEVVTIDNWQIVVTSAKTSQGGQFDSLRAGDVYLEINVSVTNDTGQTQFFSSFESLTLKDSSGQAYHQTFASDAPDAPDGNVTAGSKLRGTVVYEVPASMHAFEFDVAPNPFRKNVAVWNLSV